MNRKYLQVARWEYVEKVKSKAFIISLFLMPIIMIAASVVPTLLASKPDTESKIIGIIDQSGTMIEPVARLLDQRFILPGGEPNYVLRSIPFIEGNIAEAKRVGDSLVRNESIEGYLVISPTILKDSSVEYRSINVGNIRLTERINQAIRDVIVARKLQARGLDSTAVKDLTSPIGLKTIQLSKSGGEEESGFERVFFTAYIFQFMMFFLIITSGQLLVRSMLEEKSNRVIEILMSSSPANDLMAGKIIGLSGLGFTQLGFWALIGIAITMKFGVASIPLSNALLLLPYFVLGYLLYAAIFVAAGAPVSTEQEAQQIYSYLIPVLIIPIMFSFVVVQNPSSTLVKVLSLIPLLTPSMMAMRIPIQMPTIIEIVITLALLAVSSIAAIWVAGKIFRTTILVYGKRPSIRELIALVRAH